MGCTSIYQLFWGSLGTRVLTHPHINSGTIHHNCWSPFLGPMVEPLGNLTNKRWTKGNGFSRLSYTWKRMVTLQRWSNMSNAQSRLVPLSIAIYSYPWLSTTLVNLPKQGLPICPVKKSQASLFCLFLGHFEVAPARSIWPKKLQRRADDHRWRWHSQGFGMV